MARLPTPGGDEGNWGTVLNDYLATTIPTVFNVKGFGAKGDGVTDDTSSIMEAYNAIPAEGGIIYFPEGIYLLAQSTLNITKPNVTLTGSAGAIIKGKDGALQPSWLIQVKDTSDFRCLNLNFDGNCDHAGPNNDGIMNTTTQAHIFNLWNAKRVWIIGNYMHDSPGDFINTDFSDTDYCTDLIIKENYMQKCYRNGMSLTASDRLIVEGNIINGFNTCGIDIEPDASGIPLASKLISISNNIIRPNPTLLNPNHTNRKSGIQIQSETVNADYRDIKIIGNTIEGVTNSGTNYPNFGILIRNFLYFTCSNNQVTNTGMGITSGNGTSVNGSSGEIIGNHVHHCSEIGIESRYNNIISNNIVEFCGDCGIRPVGEFNIIKDNICRSNGQKTGSSFPWGMWLEYGNNLVEGNICYDTQTVKTQIYGIYIPDTIEGLTISNNDVRNNLNAGIRVPSVIGDNKIRFNRGFVTENSGTTSISSGSSTTIAHGLALTPLPQDISITLMNDPADSPGAIYISNINSTSFDVNVENAQGASGIFFGWKISAKE